MPAIRNSSLIKRFTDFFKLKTTDMLDSEAGRMLVPVITEPIPLNLTQVIDTALNDSDKTITVPSGKQWKILYGRIRLITSANAGNRNLRFQVQDPSGNIFYVINALNVQVASTTENYSLGQFGDVLEANSTFHTLPLPVNLILPENFVIRIFDSAAIDAAVDDLDIRIVVDEVDVTGE